MDIHTATEEAYKKGYEDGKRDGVIQCKDCANWYPYTDDYHKCPYCGYPEPTDYCSDAVRRT